jgi:anti-anti-sigma factor
MTALNIDLVASEEGPLLLRVTGDLEYPSIATFRAALNRAMALGRPIVINVQGLEFLDSTGLGALLEAKHAADLHGTDMRVEGHQGAVARLLRRTGTLSVLTAPSNRTGGTA